MNKYKCVACGYIYDDAVEAVKFEDLQMIGYALYVEFQRAHL